MRGQQTNAVNPSYLLLTRLLEAVLVIPNGKPLSDKQFAVKG